MSPNTQAPYKHILAGWMRNSVKSRWVRPPDVEEALPRLPAWPVTAIITATAPPHAGAYGDPLLQAFDRGQ